MQDKQSILSDGALKSTGEIFNKYWMPATAATVGTGLLSGYLGSKSPARRGETSSQRKKRILKDALISSGLVGGSLMAGGLAGGILTEKPDVQPNKWTQFARAATKGTIGQATDFAGGGIAGGTAMAGLNKLVDKSVTDTVDKVRQRVNDTKFEPRSFKNGDDLANALVNKHNIGRDEARGYASKIFRSKSSVAGGALALSAIADLLGSRGQQYAYDTSGIPERDAKMITPIIAGNLAGQKGAEWLSKKYGKDKDLFSKTFVPGEKHPRMSNATLKEPGANAINSAIKGRMTKRKFAGGALGTAAGYGLSALLSKLMN